MVTRFQEFQNVFFQWKKKKSRNFFVWNARAMFKWCFFHFQTLFLLSFRQQLKCIALKSINSKWNLVWLFDIRFFSGFVFHFSNWKGDYLKLKSAVGELHESNEFGCQAEKVLQRQHRLLCVSLKLNANQTKMQNLIFCLAPTLKMLTRIHRQLNECTYNMNIRLYWWN